MKVSISRNVFGIARAGAVDDSECVVLKRWARDVVAEFRDDLIRSVPSLLTVTTRVMVVGMDADRIAGSRFYRSLLQT